MFLNCVTTVLLIWLPLLLQVLILFLICRNRYLKGNTFGISGQDYHNTPWAEGIAEEQKAFYFTKPCCTLRGHVSSSLLPDMAPECASAQDHEAPTAEEMQWTQLRVSAFLRHNTFISRGDWETHNKSTSLLCLIVPESCPCYRTASNSRTWC